MIKTKKCSKCEEIKPLSEFHICRSAKDGLQYKCKDCVKKYHLENRNRIGVYNKAYNKSHKEERRAHQKIYYVENKEKIDAYRAANRERIKARNNSWKRNNKEKVNMNVRKRRASLANVTINDFTIEDWNDLLELYEHKCAYCGAKIDLGVDHIAPLSKGGPHTKSNIAPACRHCNCVKYTKTPAEAGFNDFVNLCRE